ncbi:hypothetical protein [Streptomyces sp. NPDC046832]
MGVETICEGPPPVRDRSSPGPSGGGLGPEPHALMAEGPGTGPEALPVTW